jgi:hypothetical protein
LELSHDVEAVTGDPGPRLDSISEENLSGVRRVPRE